VEIADDLLKDVPRRCWIVPTDGAAQHDHISRHAERPA